MQQTGILFKPCDGIIWTFKTFFNDLINLKQYTCLSHSQEICASFGASLVAIESQTEEKFIQNRLHIDFGQISFSFHKKGILIKSSLEATKLHTKYNFNLLAKTS